VAKHSKRFDETYDVVVIGAGIGGLACATYLAKKGRRVKVLEQHYRPGGCCTSFVRDGFKFDAGVLHITGGKESGAFQRVLSTLEMEDEIEFIERFPLMRFIFPGITLDMTRNVEDMIGKLKEMFPQERDGITGLFGTIRAMYEDIRLLPTLSPLLAQYKAKSYEQLVDEYIRDPKLKALVFANWDLWYPMWRCSAIDYAALLMTEQQRGYFCPQGGAQAIPDAFVRTLKRYGGDIEFGQLVDRIILDDGKAVGVQTAQGKRVKAGNVVSNAAARSTLLYMIGENNLPPDYVANLDRLEVSLSAFYLYLGVDLDPRTVGVDAAENIVYESFDNRKEWEAILSDEFAIPCFGIAIPTFEDPALAPKGKHIVIIMCMANYHWMGRDWDSQKQRVADELMAKAEKVIPGLSQHIVVQASASPWTYRRYTKNAHGAAQGWAFTPEMFLKRLPQKTPIENLYLAGHWTMPGGGVPSVALSGLRAARTILGE
jgi:prolycopene isomerase